MKKLNIIGLALAKRLVAEAHRTGVIARSSDRLLELHESIVRNDPERPWRWRLEVQPTRNFP